MTSRLNPARCVRWIRRISVLLIGVSLALPPVISNPSRAAQVTSTPAPILPTIVPPTARPAATIHVVQRGETLFKIALRYGSSVDSIARTNGISNPERIQVGQRLIIPDAQSVNGTLGDAPGALLKVIISPADSLEGLALRYGTTLERIAVQNGVVNAASAYVGLSLTLQSGAEGRARVERGLAYIVQGGDTLYGLSARFGQPVNVLTRINRLDRRAWLYPGERLIIPQPGGAVLADLPLPFSALAMAPLNAEQGRTFTLTLTTTEPTRISGSFLDRPLVDQTEDGLAHRLWVAVPPLQAPGVYPLTLTGTGIGVTTDPIIIIRNFAIESGGYTSERITLPKDQLDLLDPKVTEPEIAKILAIVAPITTKRYLTVPLGLPVPAAVTSQYGTRRSYNGGPFNQIHTGTDFAGSPGSPIYAPGPGKVVFTGTLFVRGNATIIDHGYGMYTGYWHQSQILVQVGDEVQTGQVIGRIGSSGRVTGPHLHWELFVNGVQADPIQWVREGIR